MIASYLFWSFLSVILMIVEFKTVNFYALWFAVCAAIVAFTSFLFPEVTVLQQFLAFTLFSVMKLIYYEIRPRRKRRA